MPRVLQIETDTLMPPFGVAQALLPDMDRTELFLFWLQTHDTVQRVVFWRTAVMRECLPNPDELSFVALAAPERIVPRTALVRVAL